MGDEVLIRAEHVGKKFCRDLKTSLWYGIKDVAADLLGRDGGDIPLRPREFWALEDVSFEVRRGECLGLIGRNGAGKTTLLRMLSGLIKPDRGRIEMRGRVGALIALGAGFNPLLTGRENVYINGAVLGLSKKEIDAKFDEIVDFSGIGDFIDAPVQSYSSGMNVRLGFSIAVAVKPDILLLDEVLAVGDANFQAKCFNTLARFRQEGTAFILVSHNNHMITRYCQSVLYVRQGQSVHYGGVEAGLRLLGQEMAESRTSQSVDELEWANVRGSGRVKLTGVEFLNSHGAPVQEAALGEPVTLSLNFERTDAAVRHVRLDVSIRDGDNVLYQSDNLSCGEVLELTQDFGSLKVSFPYLAANIETMDFYVSLLDPKSSEIFDWKRGLQLSVERQALNQGTVYMPANWLVSHEACKALE